jgi:hypothetical protein
LRRYSRFKYFLESGAGAHVQQFTGLLSSSRKCAFAYFALIRASGCERGRYRNDIINRFGAD